MTKMLVVYDNTGFINQCVIQAPVTLDELKIQYDERGIANAMYDGPATSIDDIYVLNGAVIERPLPTIAGTVRPVKADGVDTLTFQVTPASATIYVFLGTDLAHQEAITDGAIEFAVEVAGDYTIQADPGFPYNRATVTIEATA